MWILSSTTSFSFAQMVDQNIGDCELVNTSRAYSNINALWNQKFWNIMPTQAVNVAQDHLRTFCCKKKLLTDPSSCTNLDEVYLESPFLFDHILDIYLRRLDAFEKTDSTDDLLYDLDPDIQWRERRKFVVQVGQDPEGNAPMKIYDQYRKYWKLSLENSQNMPIRDGGREYRAEYLHTPSVKVINNDFNNWNLVNKYSNACEIVAMIYFQLQGKISVLYDGEDYSVYDRWYTSCRQLIQERIQKENFYTKMMIWHQGNLLIKNYLHSYLTQIFVQQNLVKLQEKLAQLVRFMDDVNRSTVKITSSCS